MNLSERVLREVQSRQLKPLPRWRLLLPRLALALLFALTLVLGALVVGLGCEALWPRVAEVRKVFQDSQQAGFDPSAPQGRKATLD